MKRKRIGKTCDRFGRDKFLKQTPGRVIPIRILTGEPDWDFIQIVHELRMAGIAISTFEHGRYNKKSKRNQRLRA